MSAQKAKYSYIKTLNDTNHSRLYILDNFGDDGLGCYYLGENKSRVIESTVFSLIHKIIKENGFSDLIFCGSSKGGYAALNFGFEFPNSTIIAGSPQYKLGYYLEHRKSKSLLHVILGKTYTTDDILELDDNIKNKITNNADKHTYNIYLHFSKNEHTYHEHVIHMLKDLNDYNYSFDVDIATYLEHDEVGTYFPNYLRRIIKQL